MRARKDAYVINPVTAVAENMTVECEEMHVLSGVEGRGEEMLF